MNNIVIAYRPGPNHRHYKHVDYGRSQGWQSKIVGPLMSEVVGNDYTLPDELRAEGYEVVVTELPNWSEGRYAHMEYQVPTVKEK